MKAVFDVARDGGDVYMKFAEMANLVPPGARREDYESVRKNCKVVFLAANYGGGPMSTAAKLGIAMGEATRLHQLYNETFATYRDWTQVVVNFALQACYLETWLGWRYVVEGNRPKPGRPYSPFPNDRALANWPIQAAGADLMRLAALEATHQGLNLVATVHDALIIVAPEGEADAHAAMLRQIMDQVPMAHLGMPAVVDMTVTRFPDRYVDAENPGAWAEVARGFEVG
jgi:DNA polymerase I-like protein with 3'-5' exonuclease and polymerase domains